MKLSFFKKKDSKKSSKRSNDVATRAFASYLKGWNSEVHAIFQTSSHDRESSDLVAGWKVGRDQERFNPYAKRALNLKVSNIVGPRGIFLKAQFRDEMDNNLSEINRELEREHRIWGQKGSCETTGRWSFRDCQALLLRTLIREGEAIARHVRGWDNEHGYAVQLISPHRLDPSLNKELSNGNRIILGIELNEWDRPVAYYFTAPVKGKILMAGKRYDRIDAKDIMHFFLPLEIERTRGSSEFLVVDGRMKLLNGFEEASVMAARIGAMKLAFLEKKDAPQNGYTGDDDEEDEELIMSPEPGEIPKLPDGYTVKEVDWDYPNNEFSDFRKAQLRGVSSGLDVNYNELTMDYEGVNYTSLRAASISDRDNYESLQIFMKENFCMPTYREWLRMAVLKNVFKKVTIDNWRDFLLAGWQARRWKWVDPYKEAKGYEVLKTLQVMSEDDIASEIGNDLEDVYADIKKAKDLRDELGLDKEISDGFEKPRERNQLDSL